MTPERRRDIERRKKQRWREKRLYARGLTSAGTPLRFPGIRASMQRVHEAHPANCCCYDCLWGKT